MCAITATWRSAGTSALPSCAGFTMPSCCASARPSIAPCTYRARTSRGVAACQGENFVQGGVARWARASGPQPTSRRLSGAESTASMSSMVMNATAPSKPRRAGLRRTVGGNRCSRGGLCGCSSRGWHGSHRPSRPCPGHYLGWTMGVNLVDSRSGKLVQNRQVPITGEECGLESTHPARGHSAALDRRAAADPAHRRTPPESVGIMHTHIPDEAAIDRLAMQAHLTMPPVRAGAALGHGFADQCG